MVDAFNSTQYRDEKTKENVDGLQTELVKKLSTMNKVIGKKQLDRIEIFGQQVAKRKGIQTNQMPQQLCRPTNFTDFGTRMSLLQNHIRINQHKNK